MLIALVTLLPAPVLAEPQVIPGQYLMKFPEHLSIWDQAALQSNLGVIVLKDFEQTESQLVTTWAGEEINENYAKKLIAAGIIEYIEPNYVLSISTTPNDSSFESLWGLHNTGQTGGSVDIDIDAPEAWNTSTGSQSVVIGVVDTGVNYNHPDLADNMWTNPGEIPDNGIDDDGNGVVDDVHGYNSIDDSGDPMDDNAHGSHVAGTLSGVGNNGQGVAGVSWNAKIMGLKFLGSTGFGSTQGAIDSIEYAISMKSAGVNIRVLNNSWGGGGFSQALHDTIAAANDAGILFVAAAGNSSNDNDALPSYPANYDIPNVISVAAIDHNGNLASFSNYGTNTVDLAAPGVSILSSVLGSSYSSLSGTSMATPHVAGVAGLVLAEEPELSLPDLKSRLLTTIKPLDTLQGLIENPGIVNAKNAIENEVTPGPPSTPEKQYTKQSIPVSYDTSLGSQILTVDDGYATVSLGFSFSYYGKNFSRISISSNGRVIPLEEGEDPPTSNDFSNSLSRGIVPYNDDHYPSPVSQDGGVWLKSDASAATVTWVVVPWALRNTTNLENEIRFQVKLFSNGTIEFHYLDTEVGNANYDFGASASIGLVPPSGVNGERVTVSHNTANPTEIGNLKALLFQRLSSRVHSDFDGDGRSDIVVFRPGASLAYFHILLSGSDFDEGSAMEYQLGLSTDIPVKGDFDGDDKADIAVWRENEGRWYYRTSSSNFQQILAMQWGLPGDIPVPADFDGDGQTDFAVYRTSSGTFYALLSSGGFNRSAAIAGSNSALMTVQIGQHGHDPVVGDFTGDGKDDFLTVWQLVRFWTLKDQNGNFISSLPWGLPGDGEITCDWDGDGADDYVIYRLTESLTYDWYVLTTSNKVFVEKQWGSITDHAHCDADYDGDGKGDMAVFRYSDGNWFIKPSGGGDMLNIQFGETGDIPM